MKTQADATTAEHTLTYVIVVGVTTPTALTVTLSVHGAAQPNTVLAVN